MIHEKEDLQDNNYLMSSSSSRPQTAIQSSQRDVNSSERLHSTESTDHGGNTTTARTATFVLATLLLFRIVNALSLRTFFQPDEYFQSLEPAWQMAFGEDSESWITWEWNYQLRSSLHPALFAVVYTVADKILQVLQLSSQLRGDVLAIAPNLAQAAIAALGDFYTWKLAQNVFPSSSNIACSALAMTILSPWQWFCSTRTFSNCLETTLTVAALSYWPQSLIGQSSIFDNGGSHKNQKSSRENSRLFTSSRIIAHLRLSLVLAATACVLRPTNALIWFSVGMPVILGLFDSEARLATSDYLVLLREGLFAGMCVLAISAASDKLYFEKWTFPPWQWLNFNISQDLAIFYGRNDWHYYLSQGLPLLLTTLLPFASIGMWRATSLGSGKGVFVLTSTVLLTIGALSIISHKEVRFIYPLLPILHVIAAPAFTSFFSIAAPPTTTFAPKDRVPGSSTAIRNKPALALLVLVNIIIAGYTSRVHQRGVVEVTTFLRHEYELALNSATNSTEALSADEVFVGFLMPCHSTPWRSKLIHPDLKAWALTCEPPIHLAARTEERAAYRDEADRFYDDPLKFMRTEIHKPHRRWPRYISGFAGIEDVLKEHVKQELKGVEVREKWRVKNSDWHDDQRRVGDVIVWEFVEPTS